MDKRSVKPEIQKRPQMRSGDPIRVPICGVDDKEVSWFLMMAKQCGYTTYIDKGWHCINILGHRNMYRAPDAVFKKIPDGLYVFRKEDDGALYCEGPM